MRVLLATSAAFALLGGVASASGRLLSVPHGRIVFAMNHFCLVQGANGGGKVPADCGRGEVAVVNADGSHLRVLTHDKVTESSPVWSPNGQQIAFIRPKPHTSDQIWVMNADGSYQRALTRFRNAPQLFGGDELPNLSWSPDGQQIVFAAFPTNQGGREQLFLLNVRTRAVKRLTRLSTGATNPIWSANGRWIAFVGGVAPNRIYLLSPRTHRVHALSTKRGGAVTGLGIAWSPDSRRLAFNTGGRVVSFDVAGRTFRTLARFGEEPSWSPDGQWVVFVDGNDVKEVRANGTGVRRILHVNSQKGRNSEPDWGR